MSRNSLLEAGAKSEGEATATGLRTKWFWVRVQFQSLKFDWFLFSEYVSKLDIKPCRLLLNALAWCEIYSAIGMENNLRVFVKSRM